MKALSIRQPWAWAILHAGKRVENRGWRSPVHSMHGSTFLIHAAQGMTRAEYFDACRFMLDRRLTSRDNLPDIPPISKLPRGAIVGRARLNGAWWNRDDGTDPWAVPGALGLILADVEEISWPLPYKGALGFFDVPDELLAGRSWKAVRGG